MKPILANPSWHDIEKGTALIAQQILRKQLDIEWIVGLTRGGLVPAVIMSQMLSLPMMPVNYSSKTGAGDNKNHNNSLPDILGKFESGTGRLPASPNLLIIDDICDSGKTLDEVTKVYKKRNHKVWTAALYWKSSAIHTPDLTYHAIPENSPWIIFPWEV